MGQSPLGPPESYNLIFSNTPRTPRKRRGPGPLIIWGALGPQIKWGPQGPYAEKKNRAEARIIFFREKGGPGPPNKMGGPGPLCKKKIVLKRDFFVFPGKRNPGPQGKRKKEKVTTVTHRASTCLLFLQVPKHIRIDCNAGQQLSNWVRLHLGLRRENQDWEDKWS